MDDENEHEAKPRTEMWVLHSIPGETIVQARLWRLVDGSYVDGGRARTFSSVEIAKVCMTGDWQKRKHLDEPTILGCWT